MVMEKGRGWALLSERRFRLTCLSTLIFGLCAHAYRLFNLDFSHDSLLIVENDWSFQIGLGRFMQPVYRLMRGDLTAPFLLGLLSLVWLVLANCVVISLLGLRTPSHIVPLCGVLSTNAVLTFSFATYLPWVDVYMLSYLLAALAAWLAFRYRWGFLAAWAPLVILLGLYHSYFNVVVILLMILFVRHILDGMETKELLVRAGKYLITLVGGLVLYALALRVVLKVGGIALSTQYNGLSTVGDYGGVSIPKLIGATWWEPFRYMLHPETFHPRVTAAVNAAIFVMLLAALAKAAAVRKIRGIPLALLVLCVAAMPFGVNVVYFISKGVQHSLMVFSFFFFYAFAAMLFEYVPRPVPAGDGPTPTAGRRGRSALYAALLAVMIFCNVVFANQVYLKKALEYQATMNYITKLTYSIEQTEGYVPGETPVILVGAFETSSLYAEREGFEDLTGVGLERQSAATDSATFEQWFNSILSYKINWIDTATAREYAAWPEVRAMPVYPAKGSCKIVNGVLVVKNRDVYADAAAQ